MSAMTSRLAILSIAAIAVSACGGGGGSTASVMAPVTPPSIQASSPGNAFFYQDVNNAANTVRA